MIKKIIKYSLSFIFYYSGFIAILRWIQRRQESLKILVYHRVNDNTESSSPTIFTERFRRHAAYLRKHYNVVKLTDMVAHLKNHKEMPHGAVAVTFDDGYKDIAKSVSAIVRKFDFPITVFLATDYVGRNKMLWTDSLYFYFKEKDRINEFARFREDLKNKSNEDRIVEIEKLKPKIQKDFMLDWIDIEELSSDNRIEIGSHTQTHPVLTKADRDTALREICGSKKDIEQRIKKRICGFSYPAGKFNEEIKRIVKDSGFDYACSVGGKFNTKDLDLFALSRINIDNCPVFVFATELCGILSWMRKLVK